MRAYNKVGITVTSDGETKILRPSGLRKSGRYRFSGAICVFLWYKHSTNTAPTENTTSDNANSIPALEPNFARNFFRPETAKDRNANLSQDSQFSKNFGKGNNDFAD